MVARTVDDYTGLVISQHADKHKYIATVGLSVEPFCRLQEMESIAITETTIDSARGVQLDWIGQWVGITRNVPVPITGVYFSWDDTAADGWDSGIWFDEFDPTSALTQLSDSDYRILIKAKIVANNSGGSIPEIYAVLDAAFPGNTINVIDNQNMTMDIVYTIAAFTPVQKAIIDQGLIPIKPAGVAVTYIGV